MFQMACSHDITFLYFSNLFQMVLNEQGCCKGDCYLDFGSLEDAKEALKQYKLKLAHR